MKHDNYNSPRITNAYLQDMFGLFCNEANPSSKFSRVLWPRYTNDIDRARGVLGDNIKEVGRLKEGNFFYF